MLNAQLAAAFQTLHLRIVTVRCLYWIHASSSSTQTIMMNLVSGRTQALLRLTM